MIRLIKSSDYNRLTYNLVNLEAKCVSLIQENRSLKEQVKTLVETNNNLKDSVDDLQISCDKLKSEQASLQEIIDNNDDVNLNKRQQLIVDLVVLKSDLNYIIENLDK